MSVETHTCVFGSVCFSNNSSYVCRLVHQDGSLADLTMLSASSVEATLTREEQEPQEEHREWGVECKEQPLVVVIPTADTAAEKSRILSEQRQSSTDESYQCSAGTGPEPSTEQSSGKEIHLKKNVIWCSAVRGSVENASGGGVPERLLHVALGNVVTSTVNVKCTAFMVLLSS